jgi:hypothetical protein
MSTRHIQLVFWHRCLGERGFLQGASLTHSFYFVIILLSFFTLFCSLIVYQKYKKIVPFIVGILLLYFEFIMLIPEYVLKDLSVGSGSIIGKDSIEEFFSYVSKHKNVEDRSLAELAPNYETAAAYLVHMLEARFVNLNPIIQQCFLNFMMLKTLKREILFGNFA